MTGRHPERLPRRSRRSRSAVTNTVVAGLLLTGLGGCATSAAELPTASASITPRAVPSSTPQANPVTPSASPANTGLFFHPEIGQCVDVTKERGTSPETIVSCDEVHDDEAYAKFTLEGTEYPGETVIEAKANEGCRARFADFIGVPYEDSVFEFLALHPSEDSWNVNGDRRVTCVVWYPADSVTGSLEGAGY
jgi:hypothetical protein